MTVSAPTVEVARELVSDGRTVSGFADECPHRAGCVLNTMEGSFTFTQKLKAEILPLCESGIRYSKTNGLGSVMFIFQQIVAKLSAV